MSDIIDIDLNPQNADWIKSLRWNLPDDPEWHIGQFIAQDDPAQAFLDALKTPAYAQIPDEVFDTIAAELFGEALDEKALAIDTDPDPSPKPGARRLRKYWTRGEGALKIKWGTHGDWTRCVEHLSKYVGPENAKGLCNVYHHAATGMYPGDKRNLKEGKSAGSTIDSDTPIESKGDMNGIEYKSVGVMGIENPEEGVVVAIVSVTGIVDGVKDVIHPGAYEKTLKTRTPKGVWQHTWDTPVSRTVEVKELLPGDKRLPKKLPNGEPWPAEAGAVQVKTEFNLNTQRGREAYSDVIFFGSEQEWSIGYQVPVGGATIDSKTGQRHITTLEWYEYSPVLFGAMPAARTASVKEAQLAYKSLMTGTAAHDVEVGVGTTLEDDQCTKCGCKKTECKCAGSKPRTKPNRGGAPDDDEMEKKGADVSLNEGGTYVGVLEKVLGARDAQEPAVDSIFDWAEDADAAEDDEAELEALTGLITQIESVLNNNEGGDQSGKLDSLLNTLSDIFADFEDEEESMESEDDEDDEDVEPEQKGLFDGEIEVKSVDISDIVSGLDQFGKYIQ